MKLFTNISNNAKYNAQRNLESITHYVDDESLKFHKSRVISSHVSNQGMIFSIVESYAIDMNNTRRAFRPVIFNVCGNVIYSAELENGFKTSSQALKSMREELNKINALKETKKAIKNHLKWEKYQANLLINEIKNLNIGNK